MYIHFYMHMHTHTNNILKNIYKCRVSWVPFHPFKKPVISVKSLETVLIFCKSQVFVLFHFSLSSSSQHISRVVVFLICITNVASLRFSSRFGDSYIYGHFKKKKKKWMLNSSSLILTCNRQVVMLGCRGSLCCY